MAINVVEGPTIAAGESLSDGVDISAGTLLRITTPADWTPANLTFQVSSDGLFFNDVYDVNGREVTIVCGAARGIVIDDIGAVLSAAHLKFRSGSSAHPVPQTASRVFAVAIGI
jgi:hypothetical protein